MKRNAIKTAAALMTTTVVIGTLCSCKYETPETTVSLAPGETTAPTIDLSDQSFDTAYGSQLIGYLNHQYYFEGEPIPLAESNFYFIDAFSELSQYATYYGLYPVTPEGWIDLSAPVTSDIQTADMEADSSDYANYGEFLIEYAERMLESTYIIKTLAQEQGLELSSEDLAEIDSILTDTVTPSAAAAGITNDEYLQLYYGPSCNEEEFRTIVYDYKLAELFTSDYIDNFEFDEDEINVPNTRYALFWAPEEESDEETLAAQEALANELLENCVDSETGELSLDLFDVYGTFSASNYSNGEDGAYQYSREFAVSRGACVQAYEDWAYGEDRAEGDIEVIYAPEYGYFVVGYLGTTEVDDTLKDQIAVDGMSEYILGLIDDGVYSFYTEEEYIPAVPVETTLPSATESTGVGVTAETAGNPASSKDIIMTVLAAVGGIAIVAAIIAVIKNAFTKPSTPKVGSEDDYDDDDDDYDDDEPVSDEEIMRELDELNSK